MGRPRTGSLRWRDGAWRLQVFAGRMPTGKARYVSATVRAPNTKKGEAEARRAMARLLLEVDAGRHELRDRGTFAELVERWIEAREHDWSPDTRYMTRKVVAKHLAPTLGKMRVDRIRTADISALYGRLRRDGLSASTVSRVHSYLHSVLAQAVDWQMITVNPAAGLGRKIKVPRQEPTRLPAPDAVRAAIAASQPWMAVLLRLAVHTGARRGELVALRWEDVELDHPQGPSGPPGVVRFHQTKTDSYKDVAIGEATTVVLRSWRRDVAARCLALGAGVPTWVFPSWRRRGAHMTRWAATNAWTRIRSDHGLDEVRLHDLRHTMATMLINARHDVVTVGKRGGWSNPTVLLGRYAHPVDASSVAAAVEMDSWLDGPPTFETSDVIL